MRPSVRACRFAVAGLILFALAAVVEPVAGVEPGSQSSAVPATSLDTDAEREAFLTNARVVRTRSAGKGITNTLRATLSDGVVTHDASIQTVDQFKPRFTTKKGTELNFKDSWRFNVAAYRIDRLLELGMIPTTVQRRHGPDLGSFTWWVDDVLMDETERIQEGRSPPDSNDWIQQMGLTGMFDQLIGNVDRNMGNLLIDTRWNIWMIDHSRAFRVNEDLRSPGDLTKIERGVLERLRGLDRAALQRVARDYLSKDEIDALLARRDRIVEHFDAAGATALFDRQRRCC
jgi:hypothetical protein